MCAVYDRPHADGPDDRSDVDEDDGKRRDGVVEAERFGVSGEIDRGDEEAEALHDVAELQDPKGLVRQKGKGDPRSCGSGDRKARFKEKGQGESDDE